MVCGDAGDGEPVPDRGAADPGRQQGQAGGGGGARSANTGTFCKPCLDFYTFPYSVQESAVKFDPSGRGELTEREIYNVLK